MRRIVLLAVLGCVSANPPAMTERVVLTDERGQVLRTTDHTEGITSTLTAAPEDVWAALQRTYDELGIPVKTLDRQAGVLGNRDISVVRRLAGESLSAYLNCGTDPQLGPLANSYRIELSVLSSVRASRDGGTELETQVVGQGRKIGQSTASVHCSSTGRLEARIARLTSHKLPT